MPAFWDTSAIIHISSGCERKFRGGEGEIRTHGTRKGSTVFETARFNHSRTSPLGPLYYTEINAVPQRATQAQFPPRRRTRKDKLPARAIPPAIDKRSG